MLCRKCGTKIEKEWKFCPGCGADIAIQLPRKIKRFGLPFRSLVDELNRRLKSGEETPRFRQVAGKHTPRKNGFSITIKTIPGSQPKIDIQTFGNMKNKSIARKIELPSEIKEKSCTPPYNPKETREPETKIKNLGNCTVITINLPGVKSGSDIRIKRFRESIELKAYSKDVLYFKILHLPNKGDLTHKSFKSGVLNLEFGQ